jgi:acyl-coenzyme A synthetase/AMP-(fatty) acid ligase
VERGERVVYMPRVPKAVITMLACTRIGAVHLVFGVFAVSELAEAASKTLGEGAGARVRVAQG